MSHKYAHECEHAIGLMLQGKHADAIVAFTEVLRKDPRSDLSWNNRALCLLNLGHPFDARMNFEKASEISPLEAMYWNNKGATYFEEQEIDKAVADYSKAISLKPKFPEAHTNIGNAKKFIYDYAGAAESYRKAIEANPDYATAHLHLSFVELAQGNYDAGWKEFEWRWRVNQMPERGLPQPEWKGEPLDGKTILIYSEQGHGDALQFVRYAKLVKEQYGGTVIVETRMPLVRLFKTLDFIDRVSVYGEKIPEGVDYQIAMMSLPRVVGTTMDTIPLPEVFNIDPEYKAKFWNEQFARFPAPNQVKVGICWAGMSRPGRPEAAAVDLKRSTSLNEFAPLALVPGVSWVSLQKGPAAEQVKTPPTGMTIGDWTEELDDFYDTASLVQHLDLVITVDTAVAHVAATMGVPTWVLSRWDGCWRWFGKRKDNPWYPSVTHYAQSMPNKWDGVMYEAAKDLRKLVKSRVTKAA